MNKHIRLVLTLRILVLIELSGAVLYAVPEQPAKKIYGKLPVKEVTIFKDGHAYILHEGKMKTDSQGNIPLDSLPNPVMGTFWAYSAEPKAVLTSVVSSREELDAECTALTLEDLLKGNLSKNTLIKEITSNAPWQGTVLRILEEKAFPPSSQIDPALNAYSYQPPQSQSREKIVLLKAADGIRAIPISQIQSITFLDNPSDTVSRKEIKETMTLHLNWNGRAPAAEAAVGMAYVQRGIRWIPNYRVEIDGKGHAVLKLQATLINELADLNDVTAHLVIGVPNFAFKDTPDPISFQETAARLSSHFRPDASTAYALSNAIMSQMRSSAAERRATPAPGDGATDLGQEFEGKTEDLYVFSLEHLTLRKGQRMVLPVAELTLNYEDIYTVDIAYAPPLEMRRNFSSDQQLQLARLFHKPNAVHKIRLDNTSEYPLTIAPAAILKDGRMLAQGMTTYTAVGNKGDLELTTAVNIGVKKSDEQTNMIPNAVNWNGNNYSKIEMKGTIELTNFSDRSIKLQVRRSVLGNMDCADTEGIIKQLGNGYDGLVFEEGLPFWWSWCSWPWWWYRFNTVGTAEWTVELSPKESKTLTCAWHYFWG
ncbi:MAG: hypothetical protein KBI46_10765 [Phycisphaerae bacterium]|nr:hypothetical protein [Phycisphaerae bacterium]